LSVLRGYWIRCLHEVQQPGSYPYIRSPRITGFSVRSIGGTVTASQCAWIREPELLGISDGKPGQQFALQYRPVLQRNDDEYISVCPPGTLTYNRAVLETYRWQEVSDFAESTSEDLHYSIDDRTGIVQFGPIILEPGELQHQTRDRAMSQPHDEYANGRVRDLDRYFLGTTTERLDRSGERQYGSIPPKGHEIYMVGYRWGGGEQGNVKVGTLTKLMVAHPYVKSVVNMTPALGGAQAESLESAVMRVPAWLRSRERAVTRDDFEYIVGQSQDIARVRCLDAEELGIAGRVELLVIPKAAPPDDWLRGLSPDCFVLNKQVGDRLQAELDERKLLGVNVQVSVPEYVGVKVRVEIVLTPAYATSRELQERTQQDLQRVLYTFLNPLTGGLDGGGWGFGTPVQRFEIADRCLKVPGVSSAVAIQLLRFRFVPISDTQGEWHFDEVAEDVLKLDRYQMVCSWANRPPTEPRSPGDETRFTNHEVYFLNGFEQYQPPDL